MGFVRKWGSKKEGNAEKKYFSAEFQLENPRIYFQFRLRQTSEEPMYVVVKKDSQALDCLKPGETLAMTFHFEDSDIPAERRDVVIKAITAASAIGMKDHVMVALCPQDGPA